MLTNKEIVDKLRSARDHLNGAISSASDNDLFTSGAYTRNAHAILEELLD